MSNYIIIIIWWFVQSIINQFSLKSSLYLVSVTILSSLLVFYLNFTLIICLKSFMFMSSLCLLAGLGVVLIYLELLFSVYFQMLILGFVVKLEHC